MHESIRVENLCKSYNGRAVLKGLQLQILQGEIFALLGVNGAGKTTALECMEGLRSYDSGRIVINGRIGVQLQNASLPSHIRPMEAVRLIAGWNKTKADNDMLQAFGIPQLAKKQYGQLSTGQKRRLHLALALVHDPDILFLDEPTAGLDVEGRVALHQELRRLQAAGKTILLASHDMAEVETLCDRIAILKDGDTVFTGTSAQLTDTIRQTCTIHIQTETGVQSFAAENIGDTLLAVLQDYKQKDIPVLDVTIDKGSLEQHFMDITGGTDA